MRFHILTIFPHILDSYFNESLFRRALQKKLLEIKVHNLRDFSEDRHKKVDASPYGGGPGMVLKIEPIVRAVSSILRISPPEADRPRADNAQLLICKKRKKGARVILFSTRGKKLDEQMAQRLAKYDELILICGRYEGVDERVAEHIADEEVSIGDYVLSGGELPAAVLTEAVARKLPGFLGRHESLEEIKGSYPVYTRPEVLTIDRKKSIVPKVLTTGDHKKILAWRQKKGR